MNDEKLITVSDVEAAYGKEELQELKIRECNTLVTVENICKLNRNVKNINTMCYNLKHEISTDR